MFLFMSLCVKVQSRAQSTLVLVHSSSCIQSAVHLTELCFKPPATLEVLSLYSDHYVLACGQQYVDLVKGHKPQRISFHPSVVYFQRLHCTSLVILLMTGFVVW